MKANDLFKHKKLANEWGTFDRKKVETDLILLVIAEQIYSIGKNVINSD